MSKKLVGVCARFAITAVALIVAVLPSAGRASTQNGGAQTFAVQADTYVSASAPSKSYGSQQSLKVDRTPKIASRGSRTSPPSPYARHVAGTNCMGPWAPEALLLRSLLNALSTKLTAARTFHRTRNRRSAAR